MQSITTASMCFGTDFEMDERDHLKAGAITHFVPSFCEFLSGNKAIVGCLKCCDSFDFD